MDYNVMDSLICPVTGTVFTGVITHKNLKLIVWYQGSTVVRAGDILSTVGKILTVNGVASDISIITVFPFNGGNWSLFTERTKCPANRAVRPAVCSWDGPCRFTHCPYGLKREATDTSVPDNNKN